MRFFEILFKRAGIKNKMKCTKITKIKMKKCSVIFLLFWLIVLSTLSGDILLDELPLKKGNVLLFKDHSDPNSLFYLSTEIRVASGADGTSKVSFFKLKGQERVLSFFLTHGLSAEKLNRIRQDLAEENPGFTLKGPVSFRSGKFFVFNREEKKTEIWAEGKAPLFPNQEVVVTKKLVEPFEIDLFAVFIMEYEGITKKINAILSVNWDEIHVQKEFREKTTWTTVEIRESLLQLKESGAIKLEVTGDSGDLSRVWDIAYEYLINQMFEVQEIRIDEQTSLGAELQTGRQNISYTLKKERKTGSYSIDFNRRFKDKRQIVLVSDIGNIIKKAIHLQIID